MKTNNEDACILTRINLYKMVIHVHYSHKLSNLTAMNDFTTYNPYKTSQFVDQMW